MKSSIVSKLLKVLHVVSEANHPLRFSELVEVTGINKSTLHRLLSIGVEERLLQFDPARKVYLLGSTVFDLVRNTYGRYDIQTIALGEMIALHEKLDGNITLGVPRGMDVVYLRLLEAKSPMGAFQRPGMHEKVHCSASGKVLLAYLPDEVIDLKLTGYAFERYTERTITDATLFREALMQVRENGFGTNDREEYDHLNGISAPVFNHMGEPIAVLNVWTVHAHHPLERIVEWSDALITSADRVTELVGGIKPNLAQLTRRAK